MNYEALFEPISIGNCTVKNRYAMAPLGPFGLSDSQGGWSRRGIAYYAARAKGGVGLIHTGITFIENTIEQHAAGSCPCSTQNPMHFIRTSREMVERIHAYGAKIFLQMTGGFGRVSVPKTAELFPPVAPSPIQHRWKDIYCRELTIEEIHTLVKKFGEGALYAKSAGFDGIQIHAVHEGYLLDQFAISLFNHRTDEYGGNLKNRLRIVREIREEITATCGKDFPVTIRFSPKSFIKQLRIGALPGEDFAEIGRDMPEGLEIAQMLENYGYAALDIDVGSYDAWWWSHPPMYQRKGLYIPYCKAVREVVNIPIVCAGRMDDPGLALSALESGACDIVSLGRPLLADADYVNKLRCGKQASIRPCLSCQEGCMGRLGKYSALNCAVNPACCREEDIALCGAIQKKRVLVIGGGPAGCEAARVLALRGHEPILYEREIQLGGNLLSGGVPSFKEDELALANWYTHELNRLGVSIHLGKAATAETVTMELADAVIVASGSAPKPLPFPAKAGMVCEARDALLGKQKIGERVVIVGSGIVACETALWFCQNGRRITMAVRGKDILIHNPPNCHANHDMLRNLIYHRGVRVLTKTKVCRIEEGRVIVETHGKRETLKANSVIAAIGYDSNNTIGKALEKQGIETYIIGDANRVSNIMYAIWDAHEVARNL